MNKGSIFLMVLLGLLLIGGCMTCNLQQNLVTSDENVKSKWGEVQNQYQRRADLVPNLVNTVKGAASHERETLEAVTQARARATSIQVSADDLTPQKLQQFQQAQGELSAALGRLMMISERYPDLKANQNFLALQDQLEGTENRITVARKNYNDAVQTYNVEVRKFPNNLFAGILGFAPKGMFEADAGAQQVPTVEF